MYLLKFRKAKIIRVDDKRNLIKKCFFAVSEHFYFIDFVFDLFSPAHVKFVFRCSTQFYKAIDIECFSLSMVLMKFSLNRHSVVLTRCFIIFILYSFIKHY